MAWVKIPAEHHPVFLAAVPKDPRVSTLKMFGGIAAKVNGQMFGGLFAKSFVVKLSEADREEALKLDGAEMFDPMGNGRVSKDTVYMPEDTFGDDAELKAWLRRGLDYALSLTKTDGKAKAKPEVATKTKAAAKPAAKTAAKPAAKPSAKKPASPAKKTPAPKKKR